MEIIGVIMLSFAVCFITLIIGLALFNFIILMSDDGESKIADKSKDLGLVAKVLSNRHKTKVLTKDCDIPNKQDSQELIDTGKMSTVVGLKFTTVPPNKSVTCASNETPPDHKTRVALRKKRKAKQEK